MAAETSVAGGARWGERPASQAGMRRRNLALTLRAVAEHGPLSRAAVASRIGLTRAAVSTLVEELLGSGLLTESGPAAAPGRVGRPGRALQLAVDGGAPAGIGAEIGVDHLAVCVTDLRGSVRAHREEAAGNRGRDPEAVLARLAALVREAAADCGPVIPAGLVVAVPGLVGDPDAGIVERAPNLDWTRLPAGELLRRSLGPDGPPLRVENEANLAALAELWLSRPPEARDFLHVSAEIGIGAALVMDGRLRRGARGLAGELGHMPVRPAGPPCGCGARGCLEQYAGEEAVLRAARIDPAAAARTHPGPAGRTRLLAERAAAGDRAVRAALTRAGQALGTALAGTVNLLDPDAVVLGGAFTVLAPWVLPSAERELTDRLADRAWRPERLEVSVLGREGALLGAASAIVRAIVDDPVGHLESRAG